MIYSNKTLDAVAVLFTALNDISGNKGSFKENHDKLTKGIKDQKAATTKLNKAKKDADAATAALAEKETEVAAAQKKADTANRKVVTDKDDLKVQRAELKQLKAEQESEAVELAELKEMVNKRKVDFEKHVVAKHKAIEKREAALAAKEAHVDQIMAAIKKAG